jgi:imidazolonepropionase-like amidohydrolase
MQGGVEGGVPAFVVEKTKSVVGHHLESVRRARKAGVTIAMGTDAGTPFNHHGGNLKELEHLVNVGFTPMEAIVAATRTASELLGLSGEIGTLEPGKAADLVVVDGNPLDDITLLQRRERILAVMKDGVFCSASVGEMRA